MLVTGRFTQEDTYRGDGLNLYAYCSNNPVGYYDPSGYEMCPPGNKKENNNYVNQQKQEYADKVMDKTKVEGKYPNSMQNSTILKSELELAGVEKAKYNAESHHIVGATEKRAKSARKILDEVGIEYNSAANAVDLPRDGFKTNSSITTQSPHTGRHKADALIKTNEIIIQAKQDRLKETDRNIFIDKLDKNIPGDVEAITKALHKVRCKLLDGEIILNDKK